MDWRSLAQEQKKQISEVTRTVDDLNQRLSTSLQLVSELQYQLAEQSETLATASSQNAVIEDRLDASLRESETLRTDRVLRMNQAAALKAEHEAALARSTKVERQLRQQLKEGSTTQTCVPSLALARSRAECQEAKARAENLTKQLAAANRELARSRGESAAWKDHYERDQDDEEPAPEHNSSNPVLQTQPLPQRTKPSNSQPVSPRVPIPALRRAVAASTPRPCVPPRLPATPRKRKRVIDEESSEDDVDEQSSEDDIDEQSIEDGIDEQSIEGDIDEHIPAQELADLELQSSGCPTPAGKRRRNGASLSELEDVGRPDIAADGEYLIPPFAFNAVTTWKAGGRPDGFSDDDLEGVAGELWESIQVVRDMWEEIAGQYWQYDLLKKGKKSSLPQCITKKLCGGKVLSDDVQLCGGRTLWRRDAAGKAACRDCVAHGWPCFTWYDCGDGSGGELLLLPLHEQDRVKKVETGFEIRHWLNT
ncbi:hypothetical protein LTR53_006909 [Teratosphaeriaceae sp. CCFEE 6253]|nr:hypothetical protein LTR53_006909 [Teratosphaeriaceae sp. CCFEE 6253]